MTQDRIESGGNQSRKTTASQLPDISSVTSSASKALEKVRVVHGANEGYFELAGKTVGQAKKSLRDVFNIPSDIEAVIGSQSVGDDVVLESGQSLEFTKETGTKGSEKKSVFTKKTLDVDELKTWQIRWMIRRDMAEVLKIEKENFELSWTEEDFLCCLRQRNCIGMVIEESGQIVGFLIYELHKNRLHILNIAIAREHHRKGYGKKFIEKLLGKLSSQRRKEMTLEVRETNLDAQLFFSEMDFTATSVMRNFYDDTDEDAYFMQFSLEKELKRFIPKNRIAEYLPDTINPLQ